MRSRANVSEEMVEKWASFDVCRYRDVALVVRHARPPPNMHENDAGQSNVSRASLGVAVDPHLVAVRIQEVGVSS
jgi:hypothetical protein